MERRDFLKTAAAGIGTATAAAGVVIGVRQAE